MYQLRFSLAVAGASALVTCALTGCVHAGRHAPPAPQPAATEVVAAVPEKPKPQPEPAEIRAPLCALAPDSATGLRTIQTVRRADRPDTLALVGGVRVALDRVIGDVRVAGQAPWFAAGKTLDITVGRRVQHYRTYDVGRIISPGDLAYLGTLDSVPVFVAAADIAPVQPDQVWATAGTRDLTRLIDADAALRARMRVVDVLYVPLRPTGCIFQPMLRSATP